MTDPRPTAPYTDIQAETWFDTILPVWTRPYTRLMRLDRPIGAYLLFIPGLWAVLLAGLSNPEVGLAKLIWIATLLLLGSFIMRGAGCVVNDMWDRDLDRRVERTAGRPLASGQVSLKQAALFLGMLLFLGLLILLQMGPLGIALGVVSMVPVVLYPLAKRVTDYPQAVLGMTFNFGALIGWVAISQSFQWPMIALYLGCIAWTFGYDTIYAHQDKSDDAVIGVKSTALKFANNSRSIIRISYGIAALFWALCLVLMGLELFSLLGIAGLLAITCRMMLKLQTTDFDNPEACLKTFKGEQFTGWIWASFLLLALVLKSFAQS